MEVFDKKTTEWIGLWYHPETHSYTSAAFNLAALKKFKGTVRLFVRKNKFYNNGENGRPNYQFCIRDAKADTEIALEVEDIEEEETERLYTEEEVRACIRGACLDGQSGYYPGDLLISDYVDI